MCLKRHHYISPENIISDDDEIFSFTSSFRGIAKEDACPVILILT